MWWVAGVALAACDDGASGGDPGDSAPPADMRVQTDARGVADRGPPADMRVDAAPPLPDAGPDAALGDCAFGQRACLGEDGYRICTAELQWSIEACGPDEHCVGAGECVPDPTRCLPGSRSCVSPDTPGECIPGEGYRALAPCEEGTLCVGDGRCVSPQCATAESQRSYLGCDYYAHDLQNIAYGFGATPGAPLGVVVSNATDEIAHVTVTAPDRSLAPLVGEVTIQPGPTALGAMPATVSTQVTDADGMVVADAIEAADGLAVPPGGMAVLLLPTHPLRNDSYVTAAAWRIQTDQPVAAYQFGPYCCNFSFTNDASLLLPVPALGTDYTFLGVPTWGVQDEDMDGNPTGQVSSYPATLTVVGTATNTQVEVTLPAGARVNPELDGRIEMNGNVARATLNAYQVMTLQSGPARVERGQVVGVDLSGATIRASKPVAVFSGHSCTYYPWDQGACDHVEEQLIPEDTWGTDYLLTPLKMRAQNPAAVTEATFWKLMARVDGTRITFSQPYDTLAHSPPGFVDVPDCRQFLDGPDAIVLDAGQHCEFGARESAALDASAPVLVMGVMSGMDSVGGFIGSHAGDPAIFVLPPVDQYRNAYTFLAPGTYFNDFLLLQVPMDGEVTLDGQPVDLAGATFVPGSPYRYAYVEIGDGPHRIEGTQRFGIVAFAYDDWVSYAFTGGLNLTKR